MYTIQESLAPVAGEDDDCSRSSQALSEGPAGPPSTFQTSGMFMFESSEQDSGREFAVHHGSADEVSKEHLLMLLEAGQRLLEAQKPKDWTGCTLMLNEDDQSIASSVGDSVGSVSPEDGDPMSDFILKLNKDSAKDIMFSQEPSRSALVQSLAERKKKKQVTRLEDRLATLDMGSRGVRRSSSFNAMRNRSFVSGAKAGNKDVSINPPLERHDGGTGIASRGQSTVEYKLSQLDVGASQCKSIRSPPERGVQRRPSVLARMSSFFRKTEVETRTAEIRREDKNPDCQKSVSDSATSVTSSELGPSVTATELGPPPDCLTFPSVRVEL